MTQALEQDVKDIVKKLWFSGETRKNIAAECGIGAGSVTNIVNEWTKDLESADFESIKELTVENLFPMPCMYTQQNTSSVRQQPTTLVNMHLGVARAGQIMSSNAHCITCISGNTFIQMYFISQKYLFVEDFSV